MSSLIRVDDKTKTQIEELARANGTTISMAVALLLKERKLSDRVKELEDMVQELLDRTA
jgi:hypothetical protein